MPQPFQDRADAGRQLAELLLKYAQRDDVLVLGLPRGGVPVAYQIAEILQVPLDVFVVRKIGVPGQEELALGALASGGVRVFNEDIRHTVQLDDKVIDELTAREQQELELRERRYRGAYPMIDPAGKIVILVDDGLATGASMRAAIAALRRQHPTRIVMAVPVAAPQVCGEFRLLADEVICAVMPDDFMAVGLWYQDFSQTSERDVRNFLQQSRAHAVQQ